MKSYAYGKDIEPYKKALHYLIVFQDESLMKEIFPNIDFSFVHKIKDVNERRLKVKKVIDNLLITSDDNRIRSNESLQSFIQLESCQQLASIERLAIYNKSYDEIEIKPNSVIYLDPPYKSTNKYEISKDFDYEKFYSWCERQTELCFISEYSMPKDRFT